jgi:hypothetical protein
MTREEFYTIADNWYQRAHNLRRVWQNESETAERKEKAFRLWTIMYARVMNCFELSKRMQPKPKYAKGAAITGTRQPEILSKPV